MGVIGVGHLGEYHVQKYKAIAKADLIGIVDSDPARAELIAERYGTKVYSDHHDLLSSGGCGQSGRAHGKTLRSRQGRAFGGRPSSGGKTDHLPPRTGGHLDSHGPDRGLVLQVGLVERFNPAVVEMETMLTCPVFIESHRMNVFTPRGTDVDVVLDLMIHDLDIILHIVRSEVKELHAVGMSVLTGKTDIANARLIFENGTVGNLTASRVSDKALRKIRIFQQDAYMSVNCLKRELTVTKLDGVLRDANNFAQVTSNRIQFPGRDPLADQIASFVDAVLEGSEPVVSGHDGRRALQYALAIIDQIERGSRRFQAVC